jgi:ribose transport system substrate-binding protein
MKRFMLIVLAITFFGITIVGTLAPVEGRDWARSSLWNPYPEKMVDTSKYKKAPPYTMAYCNNGLSNAWSIFGVQSMKHTVHKNRDKIKNFYFTDAMDKPDKQIADMEDLMVKGVDLIIIRAATEAALDPIVSRAHKQGIPIICFSRRVKSDNFESYVSASNYSMGRIQMTWLAQVLKGKGNIVILAGYPGTSSAEERLAGGKEALARYPGIKVLDEQYTHYSVSKGKQVMQAMIQSFGKKIDGVWAVSGIEMTGGIEALHEAGIKIPITGEPRNSYMKRVQEYGFQAMAIGYPSTMAGECVELGLKILQGAPVPFFHNATRLVITTVDTEDVKSDVPWSSMTFPDRPDTEWNDHGLPKEWLPK